MSQLNIRLDYYQPGVHHVCRFCSTPLAKLKDGKLTTLGTKVHVVMLLKSGTIHRFNCCGQCAKTTNWTEEGVLQQVWDKDCEVWKNAEVVSGVDQEEAEARMKELQKDIAVSDFVFIEKSLKDGDRGTMLAKRRLKKGV